LGKRLANLEEDLEKKIEEKRIESDGKINVNLPKL